MRPSIDRLIRIDLYRRQQANDAGCALSGLAVHGHLHDQAAIMDASLRAWSDYSKKSTNSESTDAQFPHSGGITSSYQSH